MIPILKSDQINKIDAHTIQNEPISSYNLMERASKICFEEINDNLLGKDFNGTIHIFCGLGNNGGDGLVIARKLHQIGKEIKIYSLFWGQNKSFDYQKNEKKVNELNLKIEIINNDSHQFLIDKNDFVIDAIWGIGLSRPIKNFASNIIRRINNYSSNIISIDIPSGLSVEHNFKIQKDAIINAKITLTFEFPKLSFLLPETGNFVGDFKILPIGLDKEFIKKQKTNHYFLKKEDIKPIIKSRKKFCHKGDFGHSLIIAGSLGKLGALLLATKACLKSGAGLVTAQVPGCGYNLVQQSIPEAMVIKDSGEYFLESLIDVAKFSSIGIGPGINKKKITLKLINNLLDNFKSPIVIDADAINIISENKVLLKKIPKNSILTPHVGEFRRLVGNWVNDIERQDKLRLFAIKNGIYVILKGPYTSIGCPCGKVFYNSSGNPGMATAGSGDILVGILTSLLSQKYSSKEAAFIAVYIHGLSGDLAQKKYGQISLNASDIINNIHNAFKYFHL
ncbi:MAG: bifunctional ADP-dependent NAD(P)H-hydrate dehydratase/NAD(P)H-hydrate epimerase [Candidatus Marinimicrobia bacterium]|nr:bifunctional ADP-dependent NAD(P)H-hydrate dehydratase/NAD(P)H-hydrate epimerase [Candidatus Neomarinimicrobiota bacterium]